MTRDRDFLIAEGVCGVTTVVTIRRWVSVSLVHGAARQPVVFASFSIFHISHLTSLLFERHPPLAARVNTAIRLITALYFTLSPPKGLPAFRLPCTEGWGYCQLAILMRDYLPVTPFHWTQHRYTASAAAFCYTLYRSRHFLLWLLFAVAPSTFVWSPLTPVLLVSLIW